MKFWNFNKNKDEPHVSKPKVAYKSESIVNHYKYFTIFFSAVFLIISLSPLVIGQTYDYPMTVVGETQQLAQNTPIQLVNAEWNPETGLFRVDLRISGESTTISNIEIVETLSAYHDDPEAEVDMKIVDVSPTYKVVLSSKVPEGFDVLGVGLKPAYIEPEIQTDAEVMEERTIQYYFYEEEVDKNLDLQVESFNAYRIDWIALRQEELTEEIADAKENIRLNKVRIRNIEQTLEDMDIDESFMTEEEVMDHRSEMTGLKNDIHMIEKSIETEEENIETYKSRYDLYEKEKAAIYTKESQGSEED